MAKFNLAVAPTFKAPVAMPVHGGESVEVVFEFKHRTKDQLNEYLQTIKDKKDVELMEDILAGWELEDEFCRENVELLCQNFIAAPDMIFKTFMEELSQGRLKN